MKRPSLHTLLILLVISSVLVSCNQLNSSSNELIHHIDDRTEVLISLQEINTESKQNFMLNRFYSFKELEAIKAPLALLKQIDQNNKGLLSFVPLEKDKLDFLYLFKSKEPLNVDFNTTTTTYDSQLLYTYQQEEYFLYGWSKNGIHFLSSSPLLIENSIRNFNRTTTNKELVELFKKSPQKNLFIKASTNSWLTQKLQVGVRSHKNISSWIALETAGTNTTLNAHGISSVKDSIEHLLYLFKGQKPILHKASNYAPYTTESLWSFGVSDFELFDRQKDRYLGIKHQNDTLLNAVKEFAQIRFNDQNTHLVRGRYVDQLFDRYSTNPISYQGIEIKEFNPSALQKHLYPLLDLKQDRYSCMIDDVLLSASTQEALKTLISSFNTSANFNKSVAYQTMVNEFASESTINYVGQLSLAIHQLKSESKEVFGLQWVADKNYFHTHISLKELDSVQETTQIAPLFSVKLEAPIHVGPFVVTNHRTNAKELIVQDQNNQLYLIDQNGGILWKKQLNAPIQERIHQVDLYRNKRLQFAFTTENELLVLDRNGKKVEERSITLNDGNLSPLAVFDYDQSRQYRLVFAQGNSIYMLNNNAKKVNGFRFTSASAPLVKPAQHIRMNSTDYLVFQLADGSLKILNRRGDTRLPISNQFDFSTNDLYSYQGHFIFSDQKGNLHRINQQGTDTIERIFNPNHYFDIHQGEFVVLDENQLQFRDQVYNLPFGNYAGVMLIRSGNRIFITTTDKENHKIYVFDEALNLLEQFPVFGSSIAQVEDLNKDGVLELISLDGPDGILVYTGL